VLWSEVPISSADLQLYDSELQTEGMLMLTTSVPSAVVLRVRVCWMIVMRMIAGTVYEMR